jgi:hypothetical protein
MFYANSGGNCAFSGTSTTQLNKNCKELGNGLKNVEDGKSFDVDNIKETTQSVTAISYVINNTDTVVILKSDYEDFFKVGSETLRVFSNK